MRVLRLILNGKVASEPLVREAVAQVRRMGHVVEVSVTWESGDAARFAEEARKEGLDLIVAGGGDGTLNEVVNGLLAGGEGPLPAVAVLPLGTANDFARGCGVPTDPREALLLAAEGRAVHIDVAKANDRYFVNVASGGFGAHVTAATPPELKRALGGAAYALTGLIEVLNRPQLKPIRFRTAEGEFSEAAIVGAVGNGRQAGGGFQVAPAALLDDGLLDVLLVRETALADIEGAIEELRDPGAPENRHIIYRRESWLEVEELEEGLGFINLDGEPLEGSPKRVRFEVLYRRLPFILPSAAAHLLMQPM
ncbi:MAG: lipid kinase YegS [Pseudomonadota bacterium]|nr:lipid kinase YegS [Pseudomonadota bacterium]